jgi:hypothetical protein
MGIKKLDKKFKESCMICHNQISFAKDRYVKLIDYNGKRKEAQCFYHLECWKNRFSIQKENIEELVAPYLNKLRGIAYELSKNNQ